MDFSSSCALNHRIVDIRRVLDNTYQLSKVSNVILQDMAGKLKYDGDVERGVRRFSLLMTYVMVFYKLFVILVFWKASMDFVRIIKN